MTLIEMTTHGKTTTTKIQQDRQKLLAYEAAQLTRSLKTILFHIL